MKPLLIAWDFNGVLNALSADIEPYLRRWQAHGAEHIVVSSSMPEQIEKFLQAQTLDTYFAQVYGYEPTSLQWVGDSADIKIQTLKRHLRKFGNYEKVVVIGDSESDVRAGKEVGSMTCLFSQGNPGFETTADAVVHNLTDIAQFVDGLGREQKGRT